MNWEKIKREYITTDTSYAKLAAKYGMTKGAIGNKAARDKWYQQRLTHINKTLTATLTVAEEEGAREIVDACGGEVSQARVLAEIAAIAFAKVPDYVKVAKTEDGKTTLEYTDMDALTDYQKAAIASIEPTAAGIKIKLHDKAAALKLLGEYTGLFGGDGVNDEGTGVIVVPEVEP